MADTAALQTLSNDSIDWAAMIKSHINNTSGVIIQKEHHLQSLTGGCADDSDIATQNEMRRTVSGELTLLNNKRRALTEALNRVATGDFGLCAECGCDIPQQRLLHRLESPYCVACLEVLESQQRHYRQRAIA